MRVDDQSWLDRIQTYSPTIDRWRERSKSVPATQSGSSFIGDEKYGLKTSTSSWYSIAVSTEYLSFTVDSMKALSTIYPTVYMTVLRTAYIAAVNAVWLMAPAERRVRVQRALKFQVNDLNEYTKYTKGLGSSGQFPEALQESLSSLETSRESLRKVADKLEIPNDLSKLRFNQTEAVNWVANYLDDQDPLLISAYNSLWRSGSAAAHAQPYFGLTRINVDEINPDGKGGGEAYLRGDLANDVGPAFAGVSLVLGKAFQLYDQRRSSYQNL